MSAWGGPPASGAWANQVDEEEAANGGQLDPVPGVQTSFPALGDSSYPSLGESLSVKDSKRERKSKKAAPQKMSLGSFMAAESEKGDLPTGPRQRAEGEEEKRGGLGGGFKNYGGDRGGDKFANRDEEGGFRGQEDLGPSRADAADDWGTKKAFVPSGGSSRGGGFSDRGAGFGGGFKDRERSGGFSDRYQERKAGFTEGDPYRADDADKWASKSFEPGAARRGGGGFESRDREKYGGFRDDNFGSSRADTEDRWARRAGVGIAEPTSQASGPPPSGSRPRLNLQPRSADLPAPELPPVSSQTSEASNEDGNRELSRELSLPSTKSAPRSNPFGDAKPVAVKDIPDKELEQQKPTETKVDTEIEQDAPIQPSKPRSNPFASARPREEVLKEKAANQPSESQQEEGQNSSAEKQNPGTSSEAIPEKPELAPDQEEQTQNGSAQTQSTETESTEKVQESFLDKAKHNLETAVDKVTSTFQKVTTSEDSDQIQNESTSGNAKEETPVSDPAKTEADVSELPTSGGIDSEATKPETPKSESRPKSSEVRAGASWAKIARGTTKTEE